MCKNKSDKNSSVHDSFDGNNEKTRPFATALKKNDLRPRRYALGEDRSDKFGAHTTKESAALVSNKSTWFRCYSCAIVHSKSN